jgi:methylated-DNA-[protein]-cysteine S-methyltransferase
MRFRLERYASELCELLVVTDDEGTLRAIEFEKNDQRIGRLLREQYGECELSDGAAPSSITRALDAYFAGEIDALEDLSVVTAGTPFQREVWRALRAIPAGETRSYGQLAASIGCPKASRAVGAANGSNPVAIVVPCHRVIGADGSLTGFGGGLDRKRWLLDHERKFSKGGLFSEIATGAAR